MQVATKKELKKARKTRGRRRLSARNDAHTRAVLLDIADAMMKRCARARGARTRGVDT